MTPVRICVTRSLLAIALLASSARPSVAAPGPGEAPAASAPPGASAGDGFASEARLLYEEGLDLYRRGDYAAAITKLDASFARVAAPELLYDLAQAHRLNGDCPRAVEHYRRFLASEPSGILRERTLARITELEHCSAAVPAPVQALGSVPQPDPGPPPAAWLAIAAPKDRMAASATRSPDLALPRAPAARFDHFRRHPTATVVGGATTLGLAALAGYFAWRTNDAANNVSSTFRPGTQWDASGAAAEERGQTSYKLELGSAIAALIAGGISAWLVFRD